MRSDLSRMLRVVWRVVSAPPAPPGLERHADELCAFLISGTSVVPLEADEARELERAGTPTTVEDAH